MSVLVGLRIGSLSLGGICWMEFPASICIYTTVSQTQPRTPLSPVFHTYQTQINLLLFQDTFQVNHVPHSPSARSTAADPSYQVSGEALISKYLKLLSYLSLINR